MLCLQTTLLVAFATASAQAGTKPASYRFEEDTIDACAAGFVPGVGSWKVVKSDSAHGKAFAQCAKSEKSAFNVCLADQPTMKDLSIRVDFLPIAGAIDQGGGVVWRAKDAKNYYVARYNPLEENLRLYHVIDGKRTQLASADIPKREGWQSLEVSMNGDHIQVRLDSRQYLDVRDSTISEEGRVGLWTKADAVTQFDDLNIEHASDK